jgi:hypothetical protein
MNNGNGNGKLTHVVREQRQITACAMDIIKTVKAKRGRPLQPRDRMALKLLTPRNSALLLRGNERNLGCRQVTFDIVTDDVGKGVHRLVPTGVFVYNPGKGWWSDKYGTGQFLWNLYLREEPDKGMARIMQRLFGFKLNSVFGSRARFDMKDNFRSIEGKIDQGLNLYIQREEGRVETTLRHMVKAEAIYSARSLGLEPTDPNSGQVLLLFGKDKRYGISFMIERF